MLMHRCGHHLFFLCSVIVFVLDRISKLMALDELADRTIEVFSWCRLSLAFNTGISFSLFASPTGQISWILTSVIALVVAAFIIAWRLFSTNRLTDCAFGLIIGGAIGNFVDRVCFSGVIDFIEIFYHQWSWPLFNIADAAICFGFALLLIEVLNHETTTT